MPRALARAAVRLGLALLAGAGFAGILLARRIWRQGQADERNGPVDAVVVLGAAQHGGRPSGVFAARLDHAIQLLLDGAAPRLIVTGGRAAPGDVAEADVARAYAVDRGVPDAAILAEASGRNTVASLRNVASLMEARGMRSAILVSDRTHMLRALWIARDLGIAAFGSPTATSPADLHRRARLRATLHEIGACARYAAIRR